jgi:excisionase family DNA binding protein
MTVLLRVHVAAMIMLGSTSGAPGLVGSQLGSVGMDETYLTVAEVAELLRLNQQTVRNIIDRSELRAVRVGPRRVRIRQSDLDAFIAESSSQMGPTEEEARARFQVALDAVDAASGNREEATALRQLATAATKLSGALPRR